MKSAEEIANEFLERAATTGYENGEIIQLCKALLDKQHQIDGLANEIERIDSECAKQSTAIREAEEILSNILINDIAVKDVIEIWLQKYGSKENG